MNRPDPFNTIYVTVLILTLCVAGFVQTTVAETIVHDFSSPDLHGWSQQGPGEWIVRDGKLVQTQPPFVEGGFFAPSLFAEGIISMEATIPASSAPRRINDYGIGVGRYVDGNNYWWVRFGDYGGSALKGRVDDQSIHLNLGRFKIERGHTYPIWMAVRNGQVLITIDGVLKYVLTDPLGPVPAKAGGYTLANAEFDNFHIQTGTVTPESLEGAIASDTGETGTHQTPLFITELPGPGVFKQTFDNRDDMRMWHAGYLGRGGKRLRGHIRDGGFWIGTDEPDQTTMESVARMAEGTVSATVMIPEDTNLDNRWFGFEIPSGIVAIGRNQQCRIYDGKSTKSAPFGSFTPEIGRSYRVEVKVTKGKIKVIIDGKVIGEVEDPDAGNLGEIGLTSYVMTRFDDFEVNPSVPYPGSPAPTVTGTPKPRVLQSLYRPDVAKGDEAPVHGTVSVFFKNEGDGPARLEQLYLDGLPLHAGRSPTYVIWARQRPWEVPPGQVGEIQIKLRSLPPAQVVAMFTGADGAAESPIKFKHANGSKKTVRITYQTHVEPVQINFIAFSDDLKTVYAYLQNNARLYDNVPGKSSYRITNVELNGTDVTGQCRIPEREITDEVVPLIIQLKNALPESKEAFVRVATREGEVAPYGVRAFPSRFLLQMTQNGYINRTDMVQDIWNHCFNSMHFNYKVPYLAEQASALGLWHGIYGGNFLWDVMRGDKPEYGTTVGIWLDEVDKSPAEYNFMGLDWMETFLRVQGRVLPFHYNGMVSARHSGAYHFTVLTDAICRSQQAKDLREWETGRMGDIRYLEHRMTRRPSLPYYRDNEIPVPFSPLTREVLEPAPSRRRCLSPREERFLQYANYLQGAKGAYHWAYTDHSKDGFYEIKVPILRLGNGGGVVPIIFDYPIPEKVRKMLSDTWDEIGRINLEVDSVGPLLARGDLCYRARVVVADPPLGRNDGPSVETSATLAGDNSLVLFVLNHNLEYRAKKSATPSTFNPVKVTVGVTIPVWMEKKKLTILGISYKGLTELSPKREGNDLLFEFPALDVSELVLITSDPGIANQTRARYDGFAQRYASIRRDGFEQVPWTETYHRAVHYQWDEDGPFVSLSDLTPEVVLPDKDALVANAMPDGSPITAIRIQPERPLPINQRIITFAKGLLLNPGTEATYNLGEKFVRFECILAMNPDSKGTATITMKMDGKQVTTKTLTAQTPAARVHLDTKNVTSLSITTSANPEMKDPIIIGHPRLLPAGKEDKAVDAGVI